VQGGSILLGAQSGHGGKYKVERESWMACQIVSKGKSSPTLERDRGTEVGSRIHATVIVMIISYQQALKGQSRSSESPGIADVGH
jgi:hypothetical protein